MKDQQALGEFLLAQHKQINDAANITGGATLSEICDYFFTGHGKWALEGIPESPKHETVGTLTAEAYREELRSREDKHAKDMLRHLEEGVPLADDPGGD